MRLTYCKNGNVVEELTALGPAPAIPEGGAHQYTASTLAWASRHADQVLMLSREPARSLIHRGPVEARGLSLIPERLGRLATIFNELLHLPVTLNRLRLFEPDMILCAANGPPLWACCLWSRLRSIPLLCSRHGHISPSRNNPGAVFRAKLDTLIIKKSTAVICHGPFLEDELLAIGIEPQRLYRFDNSYGYLLRPKAQDKEHAQEDLTEAGRYRIVLFVGRIHRDKGVFDLLQAFEQVSRQQTSIRLVYAGAGRDFDTLQSQTLATSLAPRPTLLGNVSHDALLALFRMATCVVFPTRSRSTEARPKVLIEALVAGACVVAPNFGPFPYLVDHQINGLLFKPDSPADLAQKLLQVLSDPALRSGMRDSAREAGSHFLESPTSFSSALERALSAAMPSSTP